MSTYFDVRGDEVFAVSQALVDEDDKRPADFWTKSQEKQFADPAAQKLAKKAEVRHARLSQLVES